LPFNLLLREGFLLRNNYGYCLQVFPEQDAKWLFNPGLSSTTPIDLTKYWTIPECSGASSMDTLVSGNHLHLIVAVYYDPDRGGYGAPSIVFEVVPQDSQSIAIARRQSLPTKAAHDLDVWEMVFVDSSGSTIH
jgi:hypothetical protein